jgi:stage II sporulation SpoAA-like protein
VLAMSISWLGEITLRGGRFVHLPDGIIVGAPTPSDMTLADAKEIVALFNRFEPSGHLRVLIDQRGVSRKLETAAREYMVESLKDSLDHLAIVTGNILSRFFASGVLAATGMRSKARAFDSEDEALSWLRTFSARAQVPK